ncbi:DUF4333 domain-containing protein [Blastococcus sp. LR1]|uniref:DUF4333 domain-containing protein n=1 Tax=Blastococcus sp. LR1 TaxID=2877000 RepID=UPI001CCAD97B|nr:DUF4333 domain-containing protein [Blastococcus sp. LR1]MCA0145027.1 DUF4333 domain-containing protein [Blastococcus sp. LR1]
MSGRAGALVGAAAVLALAGCGTDPATSSQVATEAARVLEARTGVPSDVSCPDELPAEVGAELRCVLTPEGDPQEYGVTVTVTAVDGNVLDLDVQVDDEPTG